MNLRRAPELAFLPAVLEVDRTPPPPALRLLLWLLAALLGTAVAWVSWGRVDVVAVAPGRVVPRGQVKLIQPLETATMQTIHVREGQRVAAGELLFELDPTAARADHARLLLERRRLDFDDAHLQALLDGTRMSSGAQVPALPATTAAPQSDAARLARLQWQTQRTELEAALAELAARRRERRAALAASRARVAELAASLPLLTEEARAHATLVARGSLPRVAWLGLERQRISMQQALRAQREQHAGLQAELRALAAQRASTVARFRARWALERAEVGRRRDSAREELAKAARRLSLTRLRAPCAGIIQQLTVHTEGGVVTPAQPLAVLVPAHARLEIEARLPNRDSGFVHPGQDVVVKVEAFDFTRYGTLPGRLRALSRDAIEDEHRGAHYLAHITLAQTSVVIGAMHRQLAPGMRVTAEIRLGRRRLIEYLLSPLARYRDEFARER